MPRVPSCARASLGWGQSIVQVHDSQEHDRRGPLQHRVQGVSRQSLAAKGFGDEVRGLCRGEDGENGEEDQELEQEAEEVRSDDAALAGARPDHAHAALDRHREEAGRVQETQGSDRRGEPAEGTAEEGLHGVRGGHRPKKGAIARAARSMAPGLLLRSAEARPIPRRMAGIADSRNA